MSITSLEFLVAKKYFTTLFNIELQVIHPDEPKILEMKQNIINDYLKSTDPEGLT